MGMIHKDIARHKSFTVASWPILNRGYDSYFGFHDARKDSRVLLWNAIVQNTQHKKIFQSKIIGEENFGNI